MGQKTEGKNKTTLIQLHDGKSRELFEEILEMKKKLGITQGPGNAIRDMVLREHGYWSKEVRAASIAHIE